MGFRTSLKFLSACSVLKLRVAWLDGIHHPKYMSPPGAIKQIEASDIEYTAGLWLQVEDRDLMLLLFNLRCELGLKLHSNGTANA